VTKIYWQVSCYFQKFDGIFSVSATSCSLVIRWAYRHKFLAVEAKNSPKVTLFSFKITSVFLYDAMVSEVDVLEVK